MNTLASTQSFQAAMDQFPDLKNVFKSSCLSSYAIPDFYYNHYFRIFQNKKYLLTRYMLQLAKEGRIRLVNFADPANLKLKAMILPPSFTCLAGRSEDGKKLIVYANAIKRAGYKRNTKTHEIDDLKIDEMSLFGYLYSAAIAYIILTKNVQLENNVKFINNCAEFYTTLINRCISSKQYPIGSVMNDYTRLNFISALFFLQTMVGYKVDRAVSAAMKLKVVDPQVIQNESNIFSHGNFLISNFDMYIAAIEKEFSFIRPGTISLRSVSYNFRSLYGEASTFALEHFQSFINMIVNSHMGTNLYNDLTIKKSLASNLVNTLDQAFLSASQGE
jgi:hypothetical protein